MVFSYTSLKDYTHHILSILTDYCFGGSVAQLGGDPITEIDVLGSCKQT